MVLKAFLHRDLDLAWDTKAAALGAAITLTMTSFLYNRLIAGSQSSKGTRKYCIPDTTLPFIGNTLDMAKHEGDMHDWLAELTRKAKGEPVLLQLLGRPNFILLSTERAFEDVFKTHFEAFPRGPVQRDVLGQLLGNGIFGVDGTKWVHQRKTASNMFTMRALRDSMTESIRRHCVTLEKILRRASDRGEEVQLFKLLNRFTIEAFAEIGFGIKMNALESDEEHPFQTAFDRAQRALILRFVRPIWFWKLQRFFGLGVEGEFQKDMEVINSTVLGIVSDSLESRGRNESSEAKDLVSLFLDQLKNSPDSKQEQFDPVYLRDIVLNFLIAGRDTTAQTLSWFFVSLSQHPEVAANIRKEIATQIPELVHGKIDSPTMEQVQRLTYLEATLKETLRLNPAVPMNTKYAARDVVLSDGTFIPAHATVLVPSYALMRMTSLYGPDAGEFKPERWIDATTGKIITVSPFKFMSFSGGPRMCLGINLAMLEMKIVVATLMSKMDIHVVDSDKVTYDFSLTLPVRNDLRAKISAINV